MTSRHIRFSGLIAVLIAAPLASPMVAQASQTTGSVRGIVTSKGGAPIAGATLVLQNQETGFIRTIRTDAKGAFQAPLLPVGLYTSTLTANGMKSQKNDKILVSLGGTTSFNVAMEVAVASATVEVVAAVQALDAQQVNAVSAVDAKLVESIPLVTRNFQDLVRLTPGSVAGPGNPPRLMVGGARQIMNNLQIDGAGQNSNFFGEQRGGAIIPFVFGADTIKELQVITNGYDAVYGNAAGAVVNAITKSGTNELTGSTLYQIRNDSWQALAKPVPYDPNGINNKTASRTRVGNSFNANFNIGGPIIKDKLHYFIGVETYKKDLGAKPGFPTPSSAVGNTAADVTAFVTSSLYNVVTGKGGATLGQEGGNPNTGAQGPTYNQQTKNTSYFARLDYAMSEKHHLTLRLNLNKFNDTIGGGNTVFTPASNMLINETNAISWVLEANSIWTNEIFSETRLQVSNERRPFTGNAAPSPQIAVGGVNFGTKTSTPREMNEITDQLINNTTWTRGDWTIKGGVDLQKIGIDNQFFNNGNGSINFANYAMAAAWANGTLTSTTPGGSNPITWNGAVSINGGRVHIDTNLNAMYIQGQYQGFMDKRLILTAGLRYTNQTISNNPRPNSNLGGLDSANGASSTDPRFAFSLDLDGKGKTIIRGGYGWFSSPTPMLLVANTMTGNGNTITNYGYALNKTNAANLAIFNSGLLSAGQLIAGNVFNRVSNASLISLATNPAFPAGGASGVQVWDPNTKLAKAKKASIGVEHDLGNGFIVGAQATYTEFVNLQYLRNINLYQVGNGTPYNDGYADPNVNAFTVTTRPGTATVRGHVLNFGPAATTPGNPVGGFGDVWLVNSDGYGKYKALTLSTSKQFNENLGFIANVTFSKSEDTNSNERGTFSSASTVNPTSELGLASTPYPANPNLAFGTSDNDRKLVLNVAAYFPIYWGIKGSTRFNYSSGLPYSAYSGKDVNGDRVPNDLQFGIRNGERQTPNKVLDLRIVRAFRIAKHFEIEGSIDVFNVFNWAQQDVAGSNNADKKATNSDGVTPNPSFRQIQSKDFNTREVQFGIRLRF